MAAPTGSPDNLVKPESIKGALRLKECGLASSPTWQDRRMWLRKIQCRVSLHGGAFVPKNGRYWECKC